MDWTPGGLSDDVEDRRGDSGGGGGFGFGGGGGGGLGIVGVVVLVVASLVTGHNYIGSYLGGAGTSQTQPRQSQDDSQPRGSGKPIQESAAENRSAQLVSFTLSDAQKFWQKTLADQGIQYRRAKLVLYRGSTYSGCGTAQSATGPFYCPADEKIYMDLGFWDELAKFGASGEFAQAYVVAHELGHHIQNILGTEQKVRRLDQQQPAQRNHLSVDVELQADCFAGVWAKSGADRGFIHPDDIKGGLQAAASVGDDHLQKITRGTVSPESFTHGTSEQREHWLTAGYEGGTIASCNTFGSGS